jgi:hypothetical protein
MSVTNRPSGGEPGVPEAVQLIDRLVERENMKTCGLVSMVEILIR